MIDYPDGRTVTRTEVASPRFGAQGEFLSDFSIALPSGLTSTTSIEQTVDADPADPLDLTQLITTTDVNGRVFTEAFSRASLTRTSITPEGRTSTTTFDANGRVIETQLPGRLPTQMSYDTNGRLIESTQGTRSWTYAYDARSDLDSVTNPLSETTLFDHDLVGRLVREESALGNVTTFGYDEAGNMTSLTPPGQPAHTFSYTPVDLESQYTPPVLSDVSMPETTYDYSLDRELELETRPDGRVIDWQYDSAGRLSKLAFPAETRDYSYDPATGQLTDITSTSGEGLAFEYDGDLVTKTTWSGTVNASVEKQYDENFFVVRETVNGAWPVDYVYDDDGLLVQAGDMTITRDPVTGFVTSTQLDNITTQTTYNAYGERETYTAWFQSTMLYWEEHERDDLGRITKTTEIVEGVQKVWEYAYDLDGRLAEAYVDGDLRYSYTYDANGNRTQFEDPVAGVLITADYDDQDRLLRYGDTTYTYTANGERLSATSPSGVTTFHYDALANLRTVQTPGGTAVEFTVGPLSRRTGTSTNGALDLGLVYRNQLQPIARSDAAGEVTQRFIYASSRQVPEVLKEHAARYVYITDFRGSVRFLVESTSGDVAERINYSPFGIADESAALQPFAFNGGIDSPVRMLRLGERDYDPTSARWTSKDPAGLSPNPDLYQFADNDPVNLIDRTGRGASPPGDPAEPKHGGESGESPICPLKDKKLTYPADCKSKKLKKACNKNGCYTKEGSKHTLCYNGDDEHITTIPHTSKEGGTCRSNIKAINKHCLGD